MQLLLEEHVERGSWHLFVLNLGSSLHFLEHLLNIVKVEIIWQPLFDPFHVLQDNLFSIIIVYLLWLHIHEGFQKSL